MLLTSDGTLYDLPQIGHISGNDDLLIATIRIPLLAPEKKYIAKYIDHCDANNHNFLDKIILLGRSGHAQVGLDVRIDHTREFHIDKNGIILPILILALGPKSSKWFTSIISLYQASVNIRIGRLLILNNQKSLTRKEVDQAFAQGWLDCESEFTINKDGSLTIRPEKNTEYIIDDASIASDDVRRAILLHARNAILQYRDIDIDPNPNMRGNSLSILGIRFSSGPFAAKIRPKISESVFHLHGAVYLDAYRSTRIGQQYGSSGLRQIEIYNSSEMNVKKFKNIELTIDLYSKPQTDEDLRARYNTVHKRKFWHVHGTSFYHATHLDDPAIRKKIFHNLSEIKKKNVLFGRVITKQGVTTIPWRETPKFQSMAIEQAIKNVSGKRDTGVGLRSFTNSLGNTLDQGRVLVTHNLPKANDLIGLRALGIGAFIFKGMRIENKNFKEGSQETLHNIYLDGHLYETILSLYKDGVSFTFVFEENNQINGTQKTHIFEFFKGFWCRPDAKQKLEDVEIIIDMYGWHHDLLSDINRPRIDRFFKKLAKNIDAKTIGIIHGKGPGFMRIADQTARKYGFLSIGIGIDVEKISQGPNFDPDVSLDFISSERLYRQKLMDHLGLIKIFNIGGFGTQEEAAISTCSVKLMEIMPAPLIYVDESQDIKFGGEQVNDLDTGNHWNSFLDHSWRISHTHAFEYSIDNHQHDRVDISDYTLGPKWVTECSERCDSYEQVADIVIDYIKNPLQYWKKCGALDKPDMLQLAWENYQKKIDFYQLTAPEAIIKAMSVVEKTKK